MEIREKDLQKQGYRLIGRHSAIKTCLWCKKAIKGEDTCYKHKFYNIESWRCIQASVSMDVCNLKCEWCWRDINVNKLKIDKEDSPKEILNKFIEEQKGAINGYKGFNNVDKERLNEAFFPKHIALSLAGEGCFYSKLSELINEIKKRGMTSFLVTNGSNPEMLKRLIKNQPTQLYITLPASNKEVFLKVCKPLQENIWENILESLKLLKNFDRGAVRLTLVKDLNMMNANDYADLLKDIDFKFLEIKSGMSVGYARYRISYEQMPSYDEIKKFALEIARLNNLKLIDEKKESRVVLLMREDFKERKLKFQ